MMTMTETPVAWRVWWFIPSDKPFDPTYKHKREYKDFATLPEAETEKLRWSTALGPSGAVCIEPQFVSRRTREAKFQKGQDSLAALGWPLQYRPAR